MAASKNNVKKTLVSPEVPPLDPHTMEVLLGGAVKEDASFQQGLSNLVSLPEISGTKISSSPAYPKPVSEGVMGFRQEGGSLKLTVACGTAQAQGIALAKFVAMVEKMYDPERPSIVLQIPLESDGSRGGRGQLLGRILPESSAIVIGLGFTGRVVSKLNDFVKFDVYYMDRSVLTAFYVAAKMQLSSENTLQELITANEGWYKLGIPSDPANPHSLEEALRKTR